MENNWHKIWAGKTLKGDFQNDLLAALIQADGFDTGVGDYTSEQWLRMTKEFGRRAEITSKDVVLEFGCGSGAFLYALSKEFGCRVVGVDYSQSLISIAK